ncbi:CIC11C00000002763 [Sungouiella intermedia]|uniref:CIC11C00000002763 n=1 Tax=Sungouiella intermedia TaxID=45354 RepID=A0A1L0DIB3_9ASCO|nr:CIC11C00000002763 [[Candida] intermedia]
MPRFANVYWSPDYRTSIEKLTKQLVRSLGQLHELRKLIFHHIKYHHANGEFLAEFAHSSYDKDSNFRSFKELNEAKHVSRLRNISELTPEEFDLKYVFTKFVERTATELHSQLALASEIDGAVLDKLTEFIKHHEPQINVILSHFEELFQDYETSYEKIENLKLEYDTLLRLAEFKIDEIADGEKAGVDATKDEMPDVTGPSIEPIRPVEISLPPPSTDSANQSFDEIDIRKSDDFGFTFPLTIASGLHFENLEELADFLTALTRSIEVTKRKIPIPGRTNELFSSVQICDHFTKERPRGFNPTRSNLEKLGQNLMNLKIIVGTSFFAKKFTSDGMWFEWSDKVMRVVQGKPVSTETAPVSLPSQMTKIRLDDTQKFVNDMAASTSKTFNGMFKSMKTSLMRPKHGEDGIRIVEANYNEAYEELQRSKHLLDMEIYDKSQYFEHFEKLKIEVIFQSLTKLLEVIYKHSLQSTTSMHDFTLRFIEEYNKQENYNREFHNTVKNFSSGIYFPSFIAPDYLTRDNVSISQLNTNFQNIKLGFNLYKDIPLQLKVSDLVPPIASHPLNVRSIPIFLYEIVNHLNNLDTDIQSYWFAPIKHQEYWLVKYEIINMVQEFVPQDGLNVHDHNAVESAIILKVISVLKDKDASKIVNFLKNWLLEISDSIIPSTVYDSLINIYKRGNNSGADTTLEIDRVLRTIPRSNLSSVIHILEHISKVFDLNSVQSGTKEDLVEGIIRKLNLMEAIGTVPFVHLILRPSVVKNATGFKPPTVEYDAILSDLANIDVRSNLQSSLIESETKFLEKQEQKAKNLGLAKKHALPAIVTRTTAEKPDVEITPDTPRTPPRIVSAPKAKSPNPNLGADNFELRPFRTGTTPRPSPSSSPVHQKKKSMDVNLMPRSPSGNNLLVPKVEIKFEG